MLYSKALILAFGVATVSAADGDSRVSSNHGTLDLATSGVVLSTAEPTFSTVADLVGQSTLVSKHDVTTNNVFLRYVSNVSTGNQDSKTGTPSIEGAVDQFDRLAIKIDGAHVVTGDAAKGVAAAFWIGSLTSANKVSFDNASGSAGALASNVLTNSLAVTNAQAAKDISALSSAVTVVVAPTETNSWYYQCGMKLSWAARQGTASTAADAAALLTDSENQAAGLTCSCKITQSVHLTVFEPAADVEFATLNITGCTESLLNRFITVEFSKAGSTANTYVATTTDDLEIKQEVAQFQVKGTPATAVDNVVSATGTTFKTMSFDVSQVTDFHESTSLILKTKTGTTDAYKQTADNVYIRLLSSRDALPNSGSFSALNSPNFTQDQAEWVQLGVNGSMQSVSIFSAFLAMAGSFLI